MPTWTLYVACAAWGVFCGATISNVYAMIAACILGGMILNLLWSWGG